MWIFMTVGFFSVVQKHGEDYLTIRARVAGDLDLLREEYLPELSATIPHAGTDYPYRATAAYGYFSRAMAAMAGAIDYPNFKDEIARRMGWERERIYARVWSELAHLEYEGRPRPAAGGER
jgi:hypothetical protein